MNAIHAWQGWLVNLCQPLVLIQGWESGIWGQEFVWKVGEEGPWGVFWEGGSLAGKGKAGPSRCGYQGRRKGRWVRAACKMNLCASRNLTRLSRPQGSGPDRWPR